MRSHDPEEAIRHDVIVSIVTAAKKDILLVNDRSVLEPPSAISQHLVLLVYSTCHNCTLLVNKKLFYIYPPVRL